MRRNLFRAILVTAAVLAAAHPAPLGAQQSTSEQERDRREREQERAERDRERERDRAERDRQRARQQAERDRARSTARRDMTDRDDEHDRDMGPPVTRIDTTVALGQGAVVDLSLVSGEIIVTGWARSEARVKATSEHGTISFEHGARRLSLEVRSDRGRSGDTRYELTIPEGGRACSCAARRATSSRAA